MNILQQLGLAAPGDDLSAIYNDPGAPQSYAQIPQNPIAPPVAAPPQDLLAGVQGIDPSLSPPAANVLQGMNEPAPVAAPVAVPVANDSAPPRQRRSVLDMLGRAADVFAKVGGAAPQYQANLDADLQRQQQIADHSLQTIKANQQITSGAMDNTTQAGKITGQALRGVQAILAANPSADISKIWPLLAKQAGVDDTHIAAIANTLAEDPGALVGLASTLNGDDKEKYSGQVIYGRDAQGNLKAFQASQGTGPAREVTMTPGYTPVDPQTFVNTGGAMVGVGKNSGNVQRILPVTQAPDKIADRQSRETIAREGNAARIAVAGMPKGGKAGAAAPADSAGDKAAQATSLLEELKGLYGKLNESGNIVNPQRSALGNIIARAKSSGVGQAIEGTVGTEAQTVRDRIASIRPSLMQSIAKATGMSGKQLDSNSDVKLFMATVTDPTKSYQANMEAIAGLERTLARKAPAAAPRAAAPRAPVTPRNAAPANGGWGKATVVK